MTTIRSLIQENARSRQDCVYLVAPEPGQCLTFGQLNKKAMEFAGYLLRLGFQKGDKISFMMGNGLQTATIFLGAMYAGLVIAPLNLLSQADHLFHVLAHSDTKMVFHPADQTEKLSQVTGKLDREIRCMPVDRDADLPLPGSESLSVPPLPDICETDDALLLYTSGTTGLPKGVVLSHKNLIAGGKNTVTAHGLTSEDRGLCSLPLYHINAEVVSVIASLVSGGSLVMPHRFSASEFWGLLSAYRCTWFSVVPTIVSYLCCGTGTEGKDLHLDQVRFGRSASSALPHFLHRSFEDKFKISIVETMGLTETAAPVFSNPMERSRRKYGSPGVAVGNEARIVDKDGSDLPPGVPGEILIRGDNVMKGYYKAHEVTAKAFYPGGWFRTGDLGYRDEDGFFFITGRIKELIIKGGENIAPREIDDVLYKHPAVLDAGAVGIPDERYGEDIMACVVLKPGCRVCEEELIAHCRKHLGVFKTPKVIKVVDDLPKGPSGKIQRLKLCCFA